MALPAYCDVSDVETLTGLQFNAGSQPSRTRVQRIIYDTARELDGVLQAAGYPLPITGSDALGLLETYNTIGASYRAWYAAERGTTPFPAVISWQTDYRAALKALRENEIALPGLEPGDGGPTEFTTILRSPKLT
jgi:hypothetical protein